MGPDGCRAPREEDQALLEEVIAHCVEALDEEHLARAMSDGGMLTVGEAIAGAAGEPPSGG